MLKKQRMEYKLLRISKGLKQKEVAKYVGVSAALICMFEKNERELIGEHLERYKDFINNNHKGEKLN